MPQKHEDTKSHKKLNDIKIDFSEILCVSDLVARITFGRGLKIEKSKLKIR
jgi:hypothetical protein